MTTQEMVYIVVVVAAVLGTVFFGVKGQQFSQQDVEKMYERCKIESNSTDEELSAFQKNQGIPTTQHGKCLLACIFQNTGVMTQDGKYDVDGLYKLATQSYSKLPEKLAKAQQVVVECAEEAKKSHDKCEVAVLIANCTMATSIKVGLDS